MLCCHAAAKHTTRTMHRRTAASPSVRVVDKGDRFVWVLDGDVLHRDGDQPAVIHLDGTQEWYMFGLRHRDGGQPAYIGANGTRVWYRSGRYYRPDGLPAIEYANGACVNVYHIGRNDDEEEENKEVTAWWLGCLAFVLILIAALVVGRSAVLAVLAAWW